MQRQTEAWSRSPVLLVSTFLLLAAGVAAAGWHWYIVRSRELKRRTEEQLAAIADLKVRQVVNWRKERESDAAMIRENTLPAAVCRAMVGAAF